MPFAYVGIGAKVAKRRYDPNFPNKLNTVGEIEAFMKSLSFWERRALAIWEMNNPPPSIGRDWLRHPEDNYE